MNLTESREMNFSASSLLANSTNTEPWGEEEEEGGRKGRRRRGRRRRGRKGEGEEGEEEEEEGEEEEVGEK